MYTRPIAGLEIKGCKRARGTLNVLFLKSQDPVE